jgi:hypothetical protein
LTIGDIRPHEDVLEEPQFQPVEDGEVFAEKTSDSARHKRSSATPQNEKDAAGPFDTKDDYLAIMEKDEDEQSEAQ